MGSSKITLQSASVGTHVFTEGNIFIIEPKSAKRKKSPAGCVLLMIIFALMLSMCWVYSLLPGTVALAW